jgi:hypothetical protein
MTTLSEILAQINFEFKIDTNGKAFVSIRGAARLADVDEKSLRYSFQGAEEKPSKLATSLIEQGFSGAEQNNWSESGIPDTALAVILEYYGYEAQERYRTELAKQCCRAFRAIGIRSWVQKELGWQPGTTGQPYWYRRMMLYREKTKIPVGYFSIFEEIISLIGDLEAQGYVIPTGCIPDISVGKCWAFYLQKVEKINPKNVAKKYKHQYPDWAYPIEAFIYPLELLPKFRVWMEEAYKPLKMLEYFRKKDPAALPSVCRLLGLPEGK